MNHGGGGDSLRSLPSSAGPRPYLTLGLPTAQHTNNIWRLLEEHASTTLDGMSSVWHPQSQCWDYSAGRWNCWKPGTAQRYLTTPTLHSISFSDDRTALCHVTGTDGQGRFLSLLRLDPEDTLGRLPNDGWVLVREVIAPEKEIEQQTGSLQDAIDNYIRGQVDGTSIAMFHPEASVVAVGWEDPTNMEMGAVGSFWQRTAADYSKAVTESTATITQTRTTFAGPSLAAVTLEKHGQRSSMEENLVWGYSPNGRSWQILSLSASPKKNEYNEQDGESRMVG